LRRNNRQPAAPPAAAKRARTSRSPAAPAPRFNSLKIEQQPSRRSHAVDQEYEKEALILHDPGVQAYIDAIGNRILGRRPVPDKVAFRFMVLRDRW